MKKIKLLLLALSALVLMPTTLSAQEAASCGSGVFVISAYYSPVPGQARYATGSYEADIRLNGGGVTTASGTKVDSVSSPFVAAPPCMPFGTQLEIENLGSHTVLDRGGAIKGNRLDIWMGYGDVGLANALTWGKRSVYVSVNGATGNNSTFSFNIGKKSLKTYQVNTSQDPFVFLRELGFGDEGEDVARLQQILKDLHYYKFAVTGVYDTNTKLSVEQFNKDNGVLESSALAQTGRFGSRSSSQLREAIVQNREKYMNGMPSRNLGRGSKGEDVKRLQEFLYGLGLLSNVTGVYDADTVKAVIAFQVSEKIILNAQDQGAGYFGPSTQIAFDKVALSLENAITTKTEDVPFNDVLLTSISVAEMLTDSLQEGSASEQVRLLQQTLRDLNFLNIEPSGYFGPITAHAVFKFQQKIGLVKTKADDSAGFVGPATRNALNKYINSKASLAGSIKSSVDVNEIELTSDSSEFEFSTDMKIGTTHPEVSVLQKFLKDKGYFKGHLFTDYFGPMTSSALVLYKIDNKLDEVENSGFVFDLVTRSFINSQL
jgi:peptidoglycan hydrolase-like protein with peptidoglycan-binding domain